MPSAAIEASPVQPRRLDSTLPLSQGPSGAEATSPFEGMLDAGSAPGPAGQPGAGPAGSQKTPLSSPAGQFNPARPARPGGAAPHAGPHGVPSTQDQMGATSGADQPAATDGTTGRAPEGSATVADDLHASNQVVAGQPNVPPPMSFPIADAAPALPATPLPPARLMAPKADAALLAADSGNGTRTKDSKASDASGDDGATAPSPPLPVVTPDAGQIVVAVALPAPAPPAPAVPTGAAPQDAIAQTSGQAAGPRLPLSAPPALPVTDAGAPAPGPDAAPASNGANPKAGSPAAPQPAIASGSHEAATPASGPVWTAPATAAQTNDRPANAIAVPNRTAAAATDPASPADRPDPSDPTPPVKTPAPAAQPADASATGNATPNVQQPPTLWVATPAAQQVAAADQPVPVAGLAVAIATRVRDGARSFEIRLDPPDLGRIEVQLSVDGNGRATTHLRADRPDTLSLLKQDAPALQRALESAGLKTDAGGLEFSLRNQTSGGQSYGGPPTPLARIIVPDPGVPPIETAARGYGRLLGSTGGVDISV